MGSKRLKNTGLGKDGHLNELDHYATKYDERMCNFEQRTLWGGMEGEVNGIAKHIQL